MAYKGIIFDVDGTAVPLGAMEAGKELQSTIASARDTIHLSAATGRSIEVARPIIQSLGLIDPCIIMGGSAIVDSKSFDVLWQQDMTQGQVAAISTVLRAFDTRLHICINAREPSIQVSSVPTANQLLVVYALALEPDKALALIEELQVVEDVAAHSTPSWDKGKVDVHITHKNGTKEHGIHRLKEMLELESEDLVGVGDSANDMPIFNAVGHKVAIGSGSPELITLADQVAPGLEQNGLAFIINQVTRNT